MGGLQFTGTRQHFLIEKVVLHTQQICRQFQTHLCLHPRQQYGRIDRLAQVIACTQFEPQAFILIFVSGTQKQHRDIHGFRIALEPTTDLITIHARHNHIEQDQVGDDSVDNL
ncbi:hypothetical protein D3C76_1378000 [compost metagenome]